MCDRASGRRPSGYLSPTEPMRSLRFTPPVAALVSLLSGCAILSPDDNAGTLVVSAAAIPDTATAKWVLETLDGSNSASGTVTGASSDTLRIDGEARYRIKFWPVSAAVNGVAFTWAVPEFAIALDPIGGGATHEVVAPYAQLTGALRLTAVVDWSTDVRATLRRLAPVAENPFGSGFFPSSGEKVISDLAPGTFEVAWQALARPMGTQGRFFNTWNHTYRAQVDTVYVAAIHDPVIADGAYTLQTGAFRLSFSGLPPGVLVPVGFRRIDGGVLFTGTHSTTPGLESITATEFFGDYEYSVADVVTGGVTYRAAPSPVYTVAVGLTPVEVTLVFSPLP